MALRLSSNVVKSRDSMLKADTNFRKLVAKNGIKSLKDEMELTKILAACTAIAMFDADAPYHSIKDIPIEDANMILNYSGSSHIADAVKKVYLQKFNDTIDEMEEPFNDILMS